MWHVQYLLEFIDTDGYGSTYAVGAVNLNHLTRPVIAVEIRHAGENYEVACQFLHGFEYGFLSVESLVDVDTI